MRKYLVPLLLFSAIGIVFLVYWNSRQDEQRQETDPNLAAGNQTPQPESDGPKTLPQPGARTTPTPIERSRWLSELERVLERGDLKHAEYYKAKLCERINELLEDDVLVRNLIAAIRKYAIEDRDPEMRRLLLPILRVLTTPETTALVEQEYYRTTDENERLVLLDAMSNPDHNPDLAGTWAVEMAVNSEDPEHRHAAFLFVRNMAYPHRDVVIRTAMQIYGASTRSEQREMAIREVAMRAEESEDAKEFIRERLKHPRDTEVMVSIDYIETWGTLRDAIVIESLAAQFPGIQDVLRERAEQIRMMVRLKEDPETAKKLLAAKEDRERTRQAERAAAAERERENQPPEEGERAKPENE